MSKVEGSITLDTIQLHDIDTDPRTGTGVDPTLSDVSDIAVSDSADIFIKKTGAATGWVKVINENDPELTGKADKATTYTKTDVDALLDDKSDKFDTYTKNDVDVALSAKLDLVGGTMTGKITLDGAPSSANHAANKKYVDDEVATRVPNSEKAVANGVATLGSDGKVPLSQIPPSLQNSLTYKGLWDAGTNTPDLSSLSPMSGDFYIVNTPGNTSLNGITPWEVGDWALFDGTNWGMVPSTNLITSIFGRQGNITANDGDYSANQIVYDNNISGLSSVRVKGAIDEIVGVAANHHLQHQPGGSDGLAVAAPSTLTASGNNVEGISTSLSRADHKHDINVSAPIAPVLDSANAIGSSVSLSRADHVHNINTGVPVSVALDASAEKGISGSLSRADHKHNIVTAAPTGSLGGNSTNTKGVADSLSRSDHTHDIATGTAVTISSATTNTEGVSDNLARADHTHVITIANPVAQTPDQSNNSGSSPGLARADHIHNIATASAVTINANTTNTQGNAASFSRSNHTHLISTGNVLSQTPDQANSSGSGDFLARADHIHNIATASAVTIHANSTNTQGNAASFARSNHTHSITTGNVETQYPGQVNEEGTGDALARADHKHNIPTSSGVDIGTATSSNAGSSTTFSRGNHSHHVTVWNQTVSRTSTITTTSGSDTLMTGMTITPSAGAGTYLVLFNGVVTNSSNNRIVYSSVYVNGTKDTNSEKYVIPRVSAQLTLSLSVHAIVDYSAGAIEIRWRLSGGTATCYTSNMSVIKLD